MQRFTTFLKLEFQKLEFFKKIYFKFVGNFHDTQVQFFYSTRVQYYGKLDFAKLEYSKICKSLHISETVVDCNIVYKNVLFGYFRPIT